MELVERRICDRRVLKLIRKWLDAGVLAEDNMVRHDDAGTPQGGVISSTGLSNQALPMTASGATSQGDSSAAGHDAADTPVPGEATSRDDMFVAFYQQLRALARLHLASERRNHTIQPTALVHEAWLRLARAGASKDCSEAQLLAAAARAMRQVLIDHARTRAAKKRGGKAARPLNLDAVDLASSGSFAEILAVDEAIRSLERAYPKAAEVVRLRFYVGLGMEEIAKALGMSERSACRDWSFARAWLFTRLHDDHG